MRRIVRRVQGLGREGACADAHIPRMMTMNQALTPAVAVAPSATNDIGRIRLGSALRLPTSR